MADYLDTVEAQLAELTDRGAHRRLRARAPVPVVGRRVSLPGTGGRGPRFRTDVLALAGAVLVTAAVVAIVLSAGLGAHHPGTPGGRSHRQGHVQPRVIHRHTRAPRAQVLTTTSTTTATSGPSAPAGPVPSGFAPQSFTALSEFTWWLLGTAPCSSPPCTSIVRTNDGGRSFVGTPAPRTNHVTQLRYADPYDGFAFDPQLWVTHDQGATWHQVGLSGSVSDLAIAGGEVYAIVNGGYGTGSLYRSPVRTDAWAPDAAAGNVLGGLWVHGSDVLLESAGGKLLISHDGGGNFTNYPAPPNVACHFVEMTPPVIWEHCATGTMSGTWRSTNGGQTYAPAGGGGNPPAPNGGMPNSATFAAASSNTAVVGYKQLYRTTDGGASYTPVNGPAGITWWQYLGFTDATHGVALGYVGSQSPSNERLYYTTDGGASYRLVVVR